MDIHQRLADHHRQLDELFESFAAATAAREERAQKLLGEFESALIAHFEAEELHLFPILQREFPDEILALREEHELIRRQIGRLGAEGGLDVSPDSELVQRLRKHAAREDNMLYKLVNDASTSERYQQLISYLEDMYARLVADDDS
jgi:hemerythrin-like domain-containing protein